MDSVASGETSAKFHFLGFDIGVSVEGHALGAGAEAKFGYFEDEDDKGISFKAGAALLFGGGVSFVIGW